MSGPQAITVAALVIVPTGSGQVVFVRQQRGPYRGALLLPGGKVEGGEDFADAARREAFEEAGVQVKTVTPTGVYDIGGRTGDGFYRFLMFAFLAGPDAARTGAGGHHVGEVLAAAPDQVGPHPTVMRILNDAHVAGYSPTEIEAGLRRDAITMRVYPIGGAAC